jgi:hypothetical protein
MRQISGGKICTQQVLSKKMMMMIHFNSLFICFFTQLTKCQLLTKREQKKK